MWADGLLEPPSSLDEIARAYVDVLREFYPSGPYHLCGFSAGCAIAFEMARQLRALGATVAPPVLIDGIAPGAVLPNDAHADEDDIYRRYIERVEAGLVDGRGCNVGDLRGVARSDLLEFMLAIGLASSDTSAAEPDLRRLGREDLGRLRVCRATSLALRGGYEPRIDDEALLILGIASPHAPLVRRAWQHLCPRLRVAEIPCNHDEIVFVEPYIGQVARSIAEAMRR
jgi:thioesterase domain-containing protein